MSSILRYRRWWLYIKMWWLLSIEKDHEVAEGPTVTLEFKKSLTTGFTAYCCKGNKLIKATKMYHFP